MTGQEGRDWGACVDRDAIGTSIERGKDKRMFGEQKVFPVPVQGNRKGLEQREDRAGKEAEGLAVKSPGGWAGKSGYQLCPLQLLDTKPPRQKHQGEKAESSECLTAKGLTSCLPFLQMFSAVEDTPIGQVDFPIDPIYWGRILFF